MEARSCWLLLGTARLLLPAHDQRVLSARMLADRIPALSETLAAMRLRELGGRGAWTGTDGGGSHASGRKTSRRCANVRRSDQVHRMERRQASDAEWVRPIEASHERGPARAAPTEGSRW
jgi:hypothetical protein